MEGKLIPIKTSLLSSKDRKKIAKEVRKFKKKHKGFMWPGFTKDSVKAIKLEE